MIRESEKLREAIGDRAGELTTGDHEGISWFVTDSAYAHDPATPEDAEECARHANGGRGGDVFVARPDEIHTIFVAGATEDEAVARVRALIG